jgi:transforming growth factor-beta-induced protein
MKRIMNILLILVLLMATTGVYAAEGDLVDVASGNEDFSILVSALVEADLVGALQGEGPFTVFAPTNQAFEDLLNQLNISAEDLLAHPQLSEVLLYHVVSGKVLSSDLTNGMTAETLQGESLTVDLSMGVKINDSTVTLADLDANNGVIHVVDQVLVPESFVLEPVIELPSIVDVALGNEDFSMLVSLLQKTDLVGVLQGEGPFTVFAPTNAAFEVLLNELDVTAEALMAQPELSKVLLYHVVSGKFMSTDLEDEMLAPTVNGENILVDLKDGVKINTSSVTSADIEASNGVVHVIDRVLVPTNFELQAVDMDESLPQTGDLGLLPYGLLGITSLSAIILMNKRKK